MPNLFRGILVVTLFAATGCGTYSSLRPADNLEAGQLEVQGGLAASHLVEILPVAKISYGLTDRIEVGAQYETYSLLGDIRLGILRSDEEGFALAFGVHAGAVHFSAFHHSRAAAGPNLVLGKRWGKWEVYTGVKAILDMEDIESHTAVYSARAGFRHTFRDRWIVGAEAGPSARYMMAGPLWLVEAAVFGGVRL